MKAQAKSAGKLGPVHRNGGLKVLMMYDDLPSGNRVMRVLDSLLTHCGRDVRFQSDMWKFDTLRSPSIARLAAEDAQNADIILISGHGSDDLPDELKNWFELWSKNRHRYPAALVAVLDHSIRFFSDPAQDFLKQAAQKKGMEFILMTSEQDYADDSNRTAMSGMDDAPPELDSFCRRMAHRHPTAEYPAHAVA